MKKAIQYIRISQKDQSHFSIDGQQTTNQKYAERHGIEILRTYIDEGESARDFKRTNWKLLMKDLEANKKNIDYLIVMKYDRLIRNAAEGLMALEKIEVRWNIKVLSSSEHISIDPHSPFFFKMRADMLVNAEFERRVISERSRFGTWRAKSEGRFIGVAPFGYVNARDEKDKPIIEVHPERAEIVRCIFEDYLAGIGFKQLIAKYRPIGLTLKGHSAIRRMLTNPVYAGMIEVPEFKEDASRLVKGLHQAIITEDLFYKVSDKAGGNKQKHSSLNDDVYLRGIVRCSNCKNKLTAGKSKGKLKHYWYYLCNECRHENINANKAHDLLLEIMEQLTFSTEDLVILKEKIFAKLDDRLKSRKVELQKFISKRDETIDKQHNLEEKFIMDLINNETYNKWNSRFRREVSSLNTKITELEKEEERFYKLAEDQLHLLKNIRFVFEKASTSDRQKLVYCIFSAKIELSKYFYRTPYILPIFSDKVNSINGLDIIKNGNNISKETVIPVSAPGGNTTEHLTSADIIHFFDLIHKIKTA